jgi:hypothetical protein
MSVGSSSVASFPVASKQAGAALGGGGNVAPAVSILTPAPGDNFVPHTPIILRASATDAEDGTLSGASVVWTSSKDGALGTGTELKVTLSSGVHLITVVATDSAAATGTSSITIQTAPSTWVTGTKTGLGGTVMPWRLGVPGDLSVKKPLVCYTGGAADRGNTNATLTHGLGLIYNADLNASTDFFALILQTPSADAAGYANGSEQRLAQISLIRELIVLYPQIDASRISFIGYSTGGVYAWDNAVMAPDLWSCVVSFSSILVQAHLGTATNLVVPVDLASDNETWDLVANTGVGHKLPLMAVCGQLDTSPDRIGNNRSFVARWVADGLPFVTKVHGTADPGTTDRYVLWEWPTYGHTSGASDFSDVVMPLSNTTFWNWVLGWSRNTPTRINPRSGKRWS